MRRVFAAWLAAAQTSLMRPVWRPGRELYDDRPIPSKSDPSCACNLRGIRGGGQGIGANVGRGIRLERRRPADNAPPRNVCRAGWKSQCRPLQNRRRLRIITRVMGRRSSAQQTRRNPLPASESRLAGDVRRRADSTAYHGMVNTKTGPLPHTRPASHTRSQRRLLS